MKQVLISIIDKNTLYINYSDMNDKTYQVDEKDKSFTESFYSGDI